MKALTCVFLLVAVMALLVVGCKKDDSPAAPEVAVIPTELVGLWTAQSASLGGQSKTLAEAFGLPSNATTVTLTFTAGGAFSFKQIDANKNAVFSMDGTVKVEGSYMTCTSEWEGQPLILINGPWQLSGGQLTITTYNNRLAGQVAVVYTK
jgi:hypothetical protein